MRWVPPMMSDPFGTNTWFYVFRQQPGHEKITQQTLTLTFNSSGRVNQH
ncbi:SmpA/OmlA domain-containing protein [Raoultella ornithinolytica]|nr:SmpA/OmlA domain-containing protein [Raoultella ornithinolytica]